MVFDVDKVDQTQHAITIEKVDENGELLNGSTFMAVNPPVTLTLDENSSEGKFVFRYSIASNNDDFLWT